MRKYSSGAAFSSATQCNIRACVLLFAYMHICNAHRTKKTRICAKRILATLRQETRVRALLFQASCTVTSGSSSEHLYAKNVLCKHGGRDTTGLVPTRSTSRVSMFQNSLTSEWDAFNHGSSPNSFRVK